MESTSKAMQLTLTKLTYIVETPCPECRGDMRAWREKEGDPPRCATVCLACGYRSLQKKEAITTKKLFEESMKTKAMNYLNYGSIITNKKLLEFRLDQYKEIDLETINAKQVAMSALDKFKNGEEVHVIFSGSTGTGKSSLSVGILQEALVQSNYDKKCLFINYRELLEQLKFAMNDAEVRKKITGTVMKEIKLADLIVLDDIGAELGTIKDEARGSVYNLDTLTAITEARENKATIFNTNLTSVQIKEAYGERILSRMMNNSTGLMFRFKNTSDKRIAGI
ncbi:putative ATPase, AAA-superfamily [Carnobacterium sp. 17-4]|uniref:ATP-binding protein n=1 Tax=Carnobacterium sp. (strain 17-4) TaxID=208596 RepID=UPI0002058CDF|nr:ATP-binding protein [Carnobacterium sp. 17-4]AEB29585.1 putative ATPase, AAA-superfamily [Carnobacterium sp. 17-4]